jgi:hypothetical protein
MMRGVFASQNAEGGVGNLDPEGARPEAEAHAQPRFV